MSVYSIAVQADGKILVGGSFTSIGGQTRNNIARLNPDALWLSMHSVSSNAIYNSQAGVDDAIELIANDAVLKTGQPAVTSGLVADGVTPLLLELSRGSTPEQPTTFQITFPTVDGGSVSGGLAQHLRVLQYAGSSGTFVTGSNVILSPAHPNGFAYISGIRV